MLFLFLGGSIELCSTVLPIKIEAMVVHGITPNLIEDKGLFIYTNFTIFKQSRELSYSS